MEPRLHVHFYIDPAAGRPEALPVGVFEARPHLQLRRRVHQANHINPDVLIRTDLEFLAALITQDGSHIQSFDCSDFAVLAVPLEAIFEDKISDHSIAVFAGSGLDQVLADAGVVAMVCSEDGLWHRVAGDIGFVRLRVDEGCVRFPRVIGMEIGCVACHRLQHQSWRSLIQIISTGNHMVHPQSIVCRLPDGLSLLEIVRLSEHISKPESPLISQLSLFLRIEAGLVHCQSFCAHASQSSENPREPQSGMRYLSIYFPDIYDFVLVYSSILFPIEIPHSVEFPILGAVAPNSKK